MTPDVPRIEAARADFQARFDAEKPKSDRNKLGQFATPFALAKQITDFALAHASTSGPVRFLDPAFGTGAFLTALVASLKGRPLEWAKGFEVDPKLAAFSRATFRDYPFTLVHADFTNARPPEEASQLATLVVCNPPYVRHHHIPPDTKRRLQRAALHRTSYPLNGLSGLYCYFILLSRSWMAQDALAGWLVPTEFMDVQYGKYVREFLLNGVNLTHIHRFAPTDLQFADALVSSSLVWFRNEPPKADSQVAFSFGSSLLEPDYSRFVARDELEHSSKWTAFASPPNLATPRPTPSLRLRDLFHIKRGIATGANSFFILEEAKLAELDLPTECFTPILPSPRSIDTQIIQADADGLPLLDRRLFLLDCDLPIESIRQQYPPLWRYLQEGQARGIHNGYLCRSRSPWYAQERRPPAPILCTYMARARHSGSPTFRFFLNRSRATAPNVYLMLYPRHDTVAPMSQESHVLEAVWRHLSALNDRDLVPEGRVYGGGLYKLEPAELGNLPADFALEPLASRCDNPSQLPLRFTA